MEAVRQGVAGRGLAGQELGQLGGGLL